MCNMLNECLFPMGNSYAEVRGCSSEFLEPQILPAPIYGSPTPASHCSKFVEQQLHHFLIDSVVQCVLLAQGFSPY